MVAVATMALSWCASTGTRYASDLPVPVPGLHQQVLAGLEGVGDRLGHLLLALARRPTDGGDGRLEQLVDASAAWGCRTPDQPRASRRQRPSVHTPTANNEELADAIAQ